MTAAFLSFALMGGQSLDLSLNVVLAEIQLSLGSEEAHYKEIGAEGHDYHPDGSELHPFKECEGGLCKSEHDLNITVAGSEKVAEEEG